MENGVWRRVMDGMTLVGRTAPNSQRRFLRFYPPTPPHANLVRFSQLVLSLNTSSLCFSPLSALRARGPLLIADEPGGGPGAYANAMATATGMHFEIRYSALSIHVTE